MKGTIFLRALGIFILSLWSVNTAIAQKSVRIAAAANLRYALSEIEKIYEAKEGVDLQITYGASGTFYQQILSGAPYDIFLSADEIYPAKLTEQNLTVGECRVYACGKLAIYGLRNNIDILQLEVLKEPYINRIAIANPRTAPYGTRSVELLKKLGWWSDIESKVVYGDSIAQAAQFAMTGNSDLGFVALSLLTNPNAELKGSYFVIPEDLYDPIAQAGVVIKQNRKNDIAEDFFEYLLSLSCLDVWNKYGYSSPK